MHPATAAFRYGGRLRQNPVVLLHGRRLFSASVRTDAQLLALRLLCRTRRHHRSLRCQSTGA